MGVGLLKRHLVYNEMLQKEEQEWKATCDKLIEDHQELKEESKRLNLLNSLNFRGKIRGIDKA